MLLAEGVEWKRVYWMRGSPPKGSRLQYDVKDPPCLGWSGVVVLPGEVRSILFCPHSFEAFQVRNEMAEISTAREPEGAKTPEQTRAWLIEHLRKKWEEYQSLGFMRDYDTAALVFKRLGVEAPAQLVKGGEEDTRERGGKPAAKRLLKPVKRKGKRGDFLKWFLDGEGSRSIRETLAETGMSRSNALSYLFTLNKDHGIGYSIVGDVVTIDVPGGVDPFDGAPTPEPEPDEEFLGPDEEEGSDDDGDDSWLE